MEIGLVEVSYDRDMLSCGGISFVKMHFIW